MAVNNGLNYNFIKQTLESNHQREIQSIAEHIQNSIEQSRAGAKLYEDMIGEMLRTASIAIQHSLPPKLEDVTTEQLIQLKNQMNLEDLSLMEKTADDIVVSKSTNPNQVGMSTKSWGLWYRAFTELFEQKNVTLDWGQKLPHFWSGPYEVATSDTKSILKWGYYYDGTTDYIIDPFVDNSKYRAYQNTTGTDAIIKNTLAAYPFLLEITGINPQTFGQEIKFDTPNGELETLVHRPYFLGSYEMKNESKDALYVQTAINSNQTVSYRDVLNDKPIEKTFIPIATDELQEALGINPVGVHETRNVYVLCLVSDYKQVESRMNQDFYSLLTTIFLISAGSIVLLVLIMRIIVRYRDKAVQQTAKTYAEEVNQMFLNIRGQRHDFLNHVTVIHSFVQLQKYDALKNYTQSLIGEIVTLNDLIQIGQPEIAAIIQAKMVEAINKKIELVHEFESMSKIASGVKAVDMVRIIGNLIDNAFDEVQQLPPDRRWIRCRGWLEGKQFHFAIVNPVTRPLTPEETKQMFKDGFSTKNGAHSGLGLPITKQLIVKYKGEIQVKPEAEQIQFHIMIPIS
ncbi:sensor histidine kinase [Paenibacillus sp. y28]|uniref:sensor histidine kinase n=1 Tax=Paenibacillus sp. y28 TaxID=3129110 RepID=UPI0030187437